ncbi:MAG: cytochrome c peroxidase [Gammaproteobacteria bacterium]|nr:cytochrome-c peroxidase [Pseudomonadales bacterium]
MSRLLLLCFCLAAVQLQAQPLGLPAVPIPANNPMSADKIELGERLFNDVRFSSTAQISCSTCHDAEKAFADYPLSVSLGIRDLAGTRNAPTVVNAAYNKTQFWDGRSPDLEDQSQHPFVNPVEMGLPNHQPILLVIRNDPDYRQAFDRVFHIEAGAITMEHVKMAIAAFERTLVSGDSPFDRFYFGGDDTAMSDAAKRGFDVFLKDGRCVSCHTIEQDHALFTDHRFHNIGIGINDMAGRVPELSSAFMLAKQRGTDVDVAVLTDEDTSHLGRFAISDDVADMGAFKTPTLRNVDVTGPYMHDGSLETLREVIEHYNNGGVTHPDDAVNPYLSGGIRPLNLTEKQMNDLEAFMKALTSPQYVRGGNQE